MKEIKKKGVVKVIRGGVGIMWRCYGRVCYNPSKC